MTTQILDAGKNTSFPMDDRIFLGEGLFETIRIVQQQPCYSRLHWERMKQGALLLGLSFEISFDLWLEQLIECILRAKMKEGGVKVILSGGRAARGLVTRGDTTTLALEAFTFDHHQQAVRLCTASWRRDAENPIYQLKSINYLESIIARRQAIAKGADDALFFNLNGHATEATVANLFIIKQDKIFTPKLTDGVLAGIIRGRLIALCKEAAIPCSELSIDSTTLATSDSIFTTNALQGIRAVASIDENPLRVDHPLMDRLHHLLITDALR